METNHTKQWWWWMPVTGAETNNRNDQPEVGASAGVIQYFGIKRTTRFRLLAEAKIKSVGVGHRDSLKDARIMIGESVREFLETLAKKEVK